MNDILKEIRHLKGERARAQRSGDSGKVARLTHKINMLYEKLGMIQRKQEV